MDRVKVWISQCWKYGACSCTSRDHSSSPARVVNCDFKNLTDSIRASSKSMGPLSIRFGYVPFNAPVRFAFNLHRDRVIVESDVTSIILSTQENYSISRSSSGKMAPEDEPALGDSWAIREIQEITKRAPRARACMRITHPSRLIDSDLEAPTTNLNYVKATLRAGLTPCRTVLLLFSLVGDARCKFWPFVRFCMRIPRYLQ